MRQPAMVRQWWRSVGVVAVALTVVAYGLAFAQPAEDTQKQLEGTWTATKAERDGKAADDVVGHRLSFAGDRFQRQIRLCGKVSGGRERDSRRQLTSTFGRRPEG